MSTDKTKFLSKFMYRSYGGSFWGDLRALRSRWLCKRRGQIFMSVTSNTEDFYFTGFPGRTPRIGERIVLSEPKIRCFRVDAVDWWPHAFWGPEVNLRCTEEDQE